MSIKMLSILCNPEVSIKNMFPLKRLEIRSLNRLGRIKFLIKNKAKKINIYNDKVKIITNKQQR